MGFSHRVSVVRGCVDVSNNMKHLRRGYLVEETYETVGVNNNMDSLLSFTEIVHPHYELYSSGMLDF